jgi:hypothetical protein
MMKASLMYRTPRTSTRLISLVLSLIVLLASLLSPPCIHPHTFSSITDAVVIVNTPLYLILIRSHALLMLSAARILNQTSGR